jgi:hypothetical protein
MTEVRTLSIRWAAAVTLARIELMRMIRKGHLQTTGEVCPARQFYSLAG